MIDFLHLLSISACPCRVTGEMLLITINVLPSQFYFKNNLASAILKYNQSSPLLYKGSATCSSGATAVISISKILITF